MADNVELSAGSGGAIIAADDIGPGVWHQRVKVQHGADGSATDASDSAPLPVEIGDGTDQALVSAAGALHVDVTAALPAGTNNIGDVDVVSSALPTGAATSANQSTANTALAAIQTAVEILDNVVSGSEAQVDVVGSLPAGTNNIGDVDVATIAAGANLIGDVGIGVRTSGGTTIFRSLDLDETEEEVKASAGQVYWITAFNLSTGVRFLKFYNATAANVTVGTTTPVLTIPIPTQAASANGAGLVLSIPNGIAFGTAITVAATTGVADNDTGAPGANEVIVNIGYN